MIDERADSDWANLKASHPSRVRGLKLPTGPARSWRNAPHPSRVRGLKFPTLDCYSNSCLRTLHGCVDWNFSNSAWEALIVLAPFTGAWIEIYASVWKRNDTRCGTLPGGGEGNKWYGQERRSRWAHPSRVRGLKYKSYFLISLPVLAHPSRVRGLKSGIFCKYSWKDLPHPSRVRGLKFLPINYTKPVYKVAPFTGAWIEM